MTKDNKSDFSIAGVKNFFNDRSIEESLKRIENVLMGDRSNIGKIYVDVNNVFDRVVANQRTLVLLKEKKKEKLYEIIEKVKVSKCTIKEAFNLISELDCLSGEDDYYNVSEKFEEIDEELPQEIARFLETNKTLDKNMKRITQGVFMFKDILDVCRVGDLGIGKKNYEIHRNMKKYEKISEDMIKEIEDVIKEDEFAGKSYVC